MTTYSEAAKVYARNLGDSLEDMGCSIGLREIAGAFDAGADSLSSRVAELENLLALTDAGLLAARVVQLENVIHKARAASTEGRKASLSAVLFDYDLLPKKEG